MKDTYCEIVFNENDFIFNSASSFLNKAIIGKCDDWEVLADFLAEGNSGTNWTVTNKLVTQNI